MVESTKEGLSIIKKENKVITIYSTRLLIGVIISNYQLKSVSVNLIKFVEKIERIYKNYLIEWDGNLEIFSPIENILNEIFKL